MQNKVFGELPPGSVRPAGILLAYCKAQAEHITREAALYDDFSPSSAWLGGDEYGKRIAEDKYAVNIVNGRAYSARVAVIKGDKIVAVSDETVFGYYG